MSNLKLSLFLYFLVQLAIAIAFSITACGTAAQAEELTSTRVVQLVQDSSVLPRDCRRQVHAVVDGTLITISVFRSPFAQKDDCKIDAVLLTKELADKDSTIKHVRVLFYEFSNSNSYYETSVSVPDLQLFASGEIGKTELLEKVPLISRNDNKLMTTYGKLSYKNIIESLGIVPGPAADERASLLVRIDIMHLRGEDVSDLKKEFLHAEDLARRKSEKELLAHLSQMAAQIKKRVPARGYDSEGGKLDSLRSSATRAKTVD